MPLDQVRTHLDVADGRKLLELASERWLSTTTVTALLTYITASISAAGLVKPEYFSVKAKAADVRARILLGTKPFEVGKTCIVSIMNLHGAHWTSFAYDRASGGCILYDPMAEGREKRASGVQEAVHELLSQHVGDQEIIYRSFTDDVDFDQDDANSCGVYCAVFLELILNNVDFEPELVLPSRVYRARYMTIVRNLLRFVRMAQSRSPPYFYSCSMGIASSTSLSPAFDGCPSDQILPSPTRARWVHCIPVSTERFAQREGFS
jgi:hypothetical protein